MVARVYTISKEVAVQLTREQCLSNLNMGLESCESEEAALLIISQIEAITSMSDEEYQVYIADAYNRLMEIEYGNCHCCGEPLYDDGFTDGWDGLCGTCYSEQKEEV
jgi:RNA polymerase-binding transcription factor DksA